jgi:glycosyltransferase involved in cell wall biosynthesis
MGNHAHLAAWAALRGLDDVPRLYRISNDPFHRGREPLRRGLRDAGLRLIAADATRLICVSPAIAAREPFRRARRDHRVDVLPNGVDAAAVRARAAAASDHPWVRDGRPFLVAVGRVHPQKNYGALIEALALARARRPDLRLLVLGAAPARARRPLEARARELGLAEAVRFEGEVANPFPLLRAAAAYVLPSLWEGASNSLLEAVACGAPVVASRQAGAASAVLGHGRFGRLVDGADPADIARGVEAQLDPATRILPGERAAAFALAATTERLCAVIGAARAAHDEIQMLAEGAGHPGPLSSPLTNASTEY